MPGVQNQPEWLARAGVFGIPVMPAGPTFWLPNRGAAGPVSALVAPGELDRVGIVITNLEAAGGSTLYIGADAGVTPATGYPIPPGASLTLTAQTEIWGITVALGSAAYALASEFQG